MALISGLLSRSNSSSQTSGFFYKNEPTGILEAIDFEKVAKVSPFLGTIVEMSCIKENSTGITSVITEKTVLPILDYRRNINLHWTKEQ